MKCPGQDSRFWGQDAIFETACPKCGDIVEFFKDEPSKKCKKCGHRFVNPKMDFGCATYCRFAEQCLGGLSSELLAKRESLLKERVALEAKKRFGKNFKALGRAIKAAQYAEEMFRRRKLSDPAVIIATYLYGLPKEVGGAASGEQESALEASELLKRLGTTEELIEKVVGLITSLSKKDKTLEEAVFFDSLELTRFEEKLREDPGACDPLLITPEASEIAADIREVRK